MRRLLTITIPAGALGVGFSSKSKPPTITRVKPNSPLQNKVKAGDICLKLILKNGKEFSGLNTSELIATLNKYLTYEGRKLVMEVGPPEVMVPLPTGKLGLTFQGKPPIVTKVHDKSPMLGHVKQGYVSRTLYVNSNTSYTGLNSRNLVHQLNETTNQEGRHLKMITGPPLIKIPLPAGKIGVFFKGSPPMVMRMHEDSPLFNRIKIGYVFHALHLGESELLTSSRRLTPSQVINKLDEYSEASEGRILTLRIGYPESLEVVLPPGSAGISIKGIYGLPTISKVSATSPVKGSIRDHLVIDKIVLEDGSEFCGYSANEIGDLMAKYADGQGRTLCLKDPSLGALSPKSVKLAHPKCVALPTGPLGVHFSGDDVPYVKDVARKSPMLGEILPSLYVDALIMPDGTEYSVGGTNGLGASRLEQILKASEQIPGRAMMLTGYGRKRRVNKTIACEFDLHDSHILLKNIKLGIFRSTQGSQIIAQ